MKLAAAILLMAMITTSSSLSVGVWIDRYHSGPKAEVQLNDNGECWNFHDREVGKISSINTNGGCVIMFECKHCQCRSAKVGLGQDSQCTDHGNLASCNFDDTVASMKVC